MTLSLNQTHPFEHQPFRSLACALPDCGALFLTQHPRARFCSPRCQMRAAQRAYDRRWGWRGKPKEVMA